MLMSGGVWHGRGHLAPSQRGVCPGVVRRVPDPEGRAGQGAQEPGGATAGTLASTSLCLHIFPACGGAELQEGCCMPAAHARKGCTGMLPSKGGVVLVVLLLVRFRVPRPLPYVQTCH